MTRAIFLLTVGFSLLLSPPVFASQPPSESVLKKPPLALEKANTEAKVHLSKTYGNLPLQFEANEGQTNEQVKFLSRGSGYNLFLTPTEAVLSLSKDDQSTAIRMGLVGANSKPKMAGEDTLPGKTNYLIGNDPKKWRTNVSNFKKVRYQEVYPGIDLVYYGNQRKLEYDFIVKPGVDPKAIRMQFAGVDRMSVEAGDLILHTDSGNVIQQAPIIYQEIDGKRKTVAGNYMFLADNQVGFYLGDYDKTQPLVIDPVIEYATFLGGSDFDRISGIAVDNFGAAYVVGLTTSTDFPIKNALQSSYNGGVDIFVSKISSDGSILVYSTFLGGSDFDEASDISVDDSGSAYITAESFSFNFPTTPGAFQNPNTGFGGGMYVVKLASDGSGLAYSSFLNSGSKIFGIAVNGAGNAYVTGRTNPSSGFPTTPGAFQAPSSTSIFITKYSSDGSSLIYSSVIGGSDQRHSQGDDIAVDSTGAAYVTGFTQSTDFPTTTGAFQKDDPDPGMIDPDHGFFVPEFDVFVTKLSPDGSSLVYSTYLGGIGTDQATGIAVNENGEAYIGGVTLSENFPTTAGVVQPNFSSTSAENPDGFISKLSANGGFLIYSTFLGGSVADGLEGIGIDNSGNAYVVGQTDSSDFPVIPGGPNPGGNNSMFVSKLASDGSSLIYVTFVDGLISRSKIAVDGSGNAYVTNSVGPNSPVPTTPGAFQTTSGGDRDAFIAKISPPGPVVESNAGPDQTVNEGVTVNLDGTGSSPAGPGLIFDWNQVAGPTVTLNLTNPAQPTFTAPYVSGNTTLTFNLIVDDGMNFSDPDTVNVTVVSVNSPPDADAGNDSTVKPGAMATLNGGNSFDSENDPITFQWNQVPGTSVVLSDATAEQPTFTAPNAAVVGDILVFKLQVSDGMESSTPSAGADSAEADTVAVTIVANSQPVADAGPDQTKDEGNLVTLAGSGSDADLGDTLSFLWTQVQNGAPLVTLSSAVSPTPTFTAPTVGPGGVDIVLQLVVSDDDPVNPLSSIADEVVIHVANINDPPNCVAANASLDLGWPPTHKMELVEVQNLADPEGDGVTIVINSVTQDEPVSGLSNGDSSPDAVIQPSDPADNVLLRLERDPKGNGRVYQVNFTASDGFESCNGTIVVNVPKSRQSGAVDDGQNFDSTLP